MKREAGPPYLRLGEGVFWGDGSRVPLMLFQCQKEKFASLGVFKIGSVSILMTERAAPLGTEKGNREEITFDGLVT